MTETASLTSLFLSSFLAATLLPGGSEAVLFAVLKAYPETFWLTLTLASVGNTLGGMVSFGMGWLLPQFRHDGAAETVSHWRTQQLKHIEKVRRHGTPILLLAWVPLIGDALCLAAGWLRLNPWHAALFMLMGKFARYLLIALTA